MVSLSKVSSISIILLTIFAALRAEAKMVQQNTACQSAEESCGSAGSAPAITGVYSPRDPRCQSGDLCVFTQMPLYSQSNAELEELIRTRLGVYDGGLCVPTATSMMLGGILSEISSASSRAPWLTLFDGWEMKERVYQVGIRSKTNFEDGGTNPRRAKHLLQSLRANSSAAVKNKFVEDGVGIIDHTHPSTDKLIGLIRQDKYAILVSMSYHRKNKTILGTSWRRVGGHGLALNGFDRDALKVYDPWAEIYYVRLHQEHIKLTGIGLGKDRSVVDLVGDRSYDWGFVRAKNASNYKVTLDAYLGWAFN